ncbi:MAG: hypothetical protein EOO65_04210, partial [Methanosarcinales archaeon]
MRSYFNTRWKSRKVFDEDAIMASLPGPYVRSLVLHDCQFLLKSSPLLVCLWGRAHCTRHLARAASASVCRHVCVCVCVCVSIRWPAHLQQHAGEGFVNAIVPILRQQVVLEREVIIE